MPRRSPHDGRVDRRSVLLALGELLRSEVDLDILLRRVVDLTARAMDADRATLFVLDPRSGELVSRAAHLPELPEIRLQLGQGIAGYVAERRLPVNIPHADRHPRFDRDIDRRTGYTTRTVLSVPILTPAGPARSADEAEPAEPADGRAVLGVLQVLNRREGIFDDQDQALLAELADEVATALRETTLPSRVTGRAKDRYNRIVGDSPAMRRVYDVIARAAATSATVLLRGESGTGKELAARAIHVNSERARGPFIKIDCTAIPDGLMETELFGHEKGAFTGADRAVPGKVELAEGGTLFLDEIGDLKPALQGKLLRLLQDREFERVGGRKTLSVDVRIVSATHRDLWDMAQTGAFRADLYYRLKVVELELPPLRERGADDIARLALHFLEVFARRHHKPVRALAPAAQARLLRHSWPGNIRELEHCIESAVALCRGDTLSAEELPLAQEAAEGRRHQSGVMAAYPATGEGRRPPSGVMAAHPGDAPARRPSSGIMPAYPARPPQESGAVPPADAGDGLVLPDGLTLAEVERRYLQRAITVAAGNRSEAARTLGIGRNTLLRKLREGDGEEG